MADIVHDDPIAFAASLPDLVAGDPVDAAAHNALRSAARALNLLHHGERGASGLAIRSVFEDGAAGDGTTDDLAAFQATVDRLADEGGGIAFVPPRIYSLQGTLTLRHRVILRGAGPLSVIIAQTNHGQPAIDFDRGRIEGGVRQLMLRGGGSGGIGIDLSGSTNILLDEIDVWDFELGIQMSDGVALWPDEVNKFSAYNHVTNFGVYRCPVGIRAWEHCNQGSIRQGRIWMCRRGGAGIALDIRGALALAVDSIAVEDFDLAVKVTGRTEVSLRDIWFEADTDESPRKGYWSDIRPALGSTVRIENSHTNASRSLGVAGSLEDAITSDEGVTHLWYGAKRHHAAAPGRNLIENGDFHRAQGLHIPGWQTNLSPLLSESPDHVSAGRSYDIQRNTSPNDGIRTAFHLTEACDYVTCMVRYKNLSSRLPMFTLRSGSETSQFGDTRGANSTEWRIAAWTLPIDAAGEGLIQLTITADQKGTGSIRIDEAWAVAGATAAPSRAHAHRIEYLPKPLEILSRGGLTTNVTHAPTDLSLLGGLLGAPRGTVGAIVGLRGQIQGVAGKVRSEAVEVFVEGGTAFSEHLGLFLTTDGTYMDRQVSIRSMVLRDGVAGGTGLGGGFAPVSYVLTLIGWMLPS